MASVKDDGVPPAFLIPVSARNVAIPRLIGSGERIVSVGESSEKDGRDSNRHSNLAVQIVRLRRVVPGSRNGPWQAVHVK